MQHIIEIVNVTEIPPDMPVGEYCCRIVSVTDDIIRARFTGEPHHPMPDHTCCLIHVHVADTQLHVIGLPALTPEGAFRRLS